MSLPNAGRWQRRSSSDSTPTNRSRPEHVGALAGVTLPATKVRADRRLVTLNERLRSRPGMTDVAVLSAADLAALKREVVIRSPEEYRRAIAIAVALFMASFWLAHLIRWWRDTTGDAVLLPVVHLLTGLGLMSMMAIRDPLRDMIIADDNGRRNRSGQAIWTAVSFVDFENPRFRARGPRAPRGCGAAGRGAARLRQRPDRQRRESQPARRPARRG